MTYNIDFDIAAIVLSVFIGYCIIRFKGVKQRGNNIFLLIVLTGLFSAVADLASVYYNSIPTGDHIVAQDAWNYVYLGIHNAMPYLTMLYVFHITGISRYFSKRIHMLLTIPYLLDLVILATNGFTHRLFYYDKTGAYCHGDWFFFLYLIAFFYIGLVCFIMISKRKTVSRERRGSIMFFLFFSMVPVVYQFYHPHLLIEIFFQTLGLLGILLSIENKDQIINTETGVRNRHAYVTDVVRALGLSRGFQFSIVIPDVHYYRTTLGMNTMTEVFAEMAGWLDELDDNLTCYDCENGHFALLGKFISENHENELKKQIFDRFKQPWGSDEFSVTFPVRVCAIHIPSDVDNVEMLMMINDLEFNGRTSRELDPQLALELNERRIDVERAIMDALEAKRLQVWYQPIVEKESGRVHSAEALVRLFDDKLGYISPEEFIPIAEKDGSVVAIGEFVFEEVCRFCKERITPDCGIDYIEVNLSVVQCMNQDLAPSFERILKKYDIPASLINLEITETAMWENQRRFKQNIRALADLGFSFSLDDFGTGYANLSHLFDLPISVVKIDKSILWRAVSPVDGTGTERAAIILKHTMQMINEMRFLILTEGVETWEQKVVLEKLGCNYFQGFYYSRPLPENKFMKFTREVNEVGEIPASQ